jgi:hypothetical protein
LDYVVIGATWLLIGMLLGIVMGAKEDYQLVAVHAHINLIGFACHSIFGMVYKQWPMLNSVPIRLTQTPTRASVGHHGGHGHPPARRSGFSPVAP